MCNKKLLTILNYLVDGIDTKQIESHKLTQRNGIIRGWVRFKKPLTSKGHNVIMFVVQEVEFPQGKGYNLIEYDFYIG